MIGPNLTCVSRWTPAYITSSMSGVIMFRQQGFKAIVCFPRALDTRGSVKTGTASTFIHIQLTALPLKSWDRRKIRQVVTLIICHSNLNEIDCQSFYIYLLRGNFKKAFAKQMTDQVCNKVSFFQSIPGQ